MKQCILKKNSVQPYCKCSKLNYIQTEAIQGILLRQMISFKSLRGRPHTLLDMYLHTANFKQNVLAISGAFQK